MRMLIVDDDPEIRFIAGFLLRQAGHDVAEAVDAESALAAAADAAPEVVLMDVLLGEADGVAVAERLMSVMTPQPALIFLTGVARDDQLERLRAARPAGIIGKPFDPSTFSAEVLTLVEGVS